MPKTPTGGGVAAIFSPLLDAMASANLLRSSSRIRQI